MHAVLSCLYQMQNWAYSRRQRFASERAAYPQLDEALALSLDGQHDLLHHAGLYDVQAGGQSFLVQVYIYISY